MSSFINCKQCHRKFEAFRESAKFCSAKCKQKNWRRKKGQPFISARVAAKQKFKSGNGERLDRSPTTTIAHENLSVNAD